MSKAKQTFIAIQGPTKHGKAVLEISELTKHGLIYRGNIKARTSNSKGVESHICDAVVSGGRLRAVVLKRLMKSKFGKGWSTGGSGYYNQSLERETGLKISVYEAPEVYNPKVDTSDPDFKQNV